MFPLVMLVHECTVYANRRCKQGADFLSLFDISSQVFVTVHVDSVLTATLVSFTRVNLAALVILWRLYFIFVTLPTLLVIAVTFFTSLSLTSLCII